MSFEAIVVNAVAGETEVVLRMLMDKGILRRKMYCTKEHERKRMTLERNISRW